MGRRPGRDEPGALAVSIRIFVQGLDDVMRMAREAGTLEEDIQRIAVQAVNHAADFGRTRAQEQGQREIAFPNGYLAPGAKRLQVTQRAQLGRVQATIFGQDRPTSLARFATKTTADDQGVLVQVRKGRTKRLRRAFFMKLRRGNSETQNNLGLAIRLPKGKQPNVAYKPKEIAPGLFLLYGPSVNQMLRVLAENGLTQTIAKEAENEFTRLMDLDL